MLMTTSITTVYAPIITFVYLYTFVSLVFAYPI